MRVRDITYGASYHFDRSAKEAPRTEKGDTARDQVQSPQTESINASRRDIVHDFAPACLQPRNALPTWDIKPFVP